MAKTKEQKQVALKDLKEKLARQKLTVFIDFSKVDSATLFKLRDALKIENCNLQVVKKTLLRKVLDLLGAKELAKKVEEVEGQLALAFSFEDEVSAAKFCLQAQKENREVKILGGALGKDYQIKERILEIAELPSREELLARLVGSLNSPLSKFVYVLKANLTNFVSVLTELQKVK